MKKHYIQNPIPPSGQDWGGVPGKQYFQFTVGSEPESCEIGFTYVRHWAPYNPDVPVYWLKIDVL